VGLLTGDDGQEMMEMPRLRVLVFEEVIA